MCVCVHTHTLHTHIYDSLNNFQEPNFQICGNVIYFICVCVYDSLFFFSYHFVLLFTYSCLHFPATTFTPPPIPTSHPQSYPPLALSMDPLYMFLDDSFPSFPHYYLPPSLVTVSLFFISVSVILFCLLVCFVD